MKKRLLLIAILTSFITPACFTAKAQILSNGNAEDNWGNAIDINNLIAQKTVVIVPFSASTCGYCLRDGAFLETNYLKHAKEDGGQGFHLSAWDTQLDNYAFEKHFGWNSQTLTYPIELRYPVRSGFPCVIAYKEGKLLFNGLQEAYDDYEKVNQCLWNGKYPMEPMGGYDMCRIAIDENERKDAITVYPTGEDIREIKKKWGEDTNKNFDEMQPKDWQHHHICLSGDFSFDSLEKLFKGEDTPIHFTDKKIEIGEYSFPYDSVALYAWIPNPFYTAKFMLLRINESKGMGSEPLAMAFDFNLFDEKGKRFYGRYDLSSGEPKVVSHLTYGALKPEKMCSNGRCELPNPVICSHSWDQSHAQPHYQSPVETYKAPLEKGWIIGKGNDRFPTITTDHQGNTWIAYEEQGDIMLERIQDKQTETFIVESDSTDSYNPVIAIDVKNRIWVCYLNSRDFQYRVYARCLTPTDKKGSYYWSNEIQLSDDEELDATHLAIATQGDSLSVAWSKWVVTDRYLNLRTIVNGTQLGKIKIIKPADSGSNSRGMEDYSNAWAPSLTYLPNGTLWGVWSQHYPGSCCIIGGDLYKDHPLPISLSGKSIDYWEMAIGSSLFCNSQNIKYAVYGPMNLELLQNKPLSIKFSTYNESTESWDQAEALPGDTRYKETPIGICDKKGNPIVIWNGRAENSNWGIYLSTKRNGAWSEPRLISRDGVTSRYPKVAFNAKGNALFVSWHAGVGKDMRAEVVELKKW